MVEHGKNDLESAEQKFSFIKEIANFIKKEKNYKEVISFLDQHAFFQQLSKRKHSEIKEEVKTIFLNEENIFFISFLIRQRITEILNNQTIDRNDLLLYFSFLKKFFDSDFDEIKRKIGKILKAKSPDEIQSDPFLFHLEKCLEDINAYIAKTKESDDFPVKNFELAFSEKGISPALLDADPNLCDLCLSMQKKLANEQKSTTVILHPGSEANN